MEQLKSLWELTAEPGKEFPTFRGRSTTQVAIIGGGISGLTTAYLLGQAGMQVTLVEARTIGSGTTGRSTGNLYTHTGTSIAALLSSYGKAKTKDVFRSRSRAINFIESTVLGQNISCNFKRVGFHYYLEKDSEKGRSFLHEEFQAARQCKLAVERLPKAPLPFSTAAALRIPGQAQIHPLRYVRGLAAAMPDKVQLYENSPMVEYDAERGVAITPHGELHSDHLIMATHVPKGFFPVQTLLRPEREFACASAALYDEMPAGVFWQVDPSMYSLRRFHDHKAAYVMLIGNYHKTAHPTADEDPFSTLHAYLRERFTLSGPSLQWGAQSYLPADSLPFIGHVKGRLYYMTGYGADGLVFGTLAGMLISEQIRQRDSRWGSLYSACRLRPFKSARSFLCEVSDSAYHMAKDRLLPPPGSPAMLANGEAGVFKIKGEHLAVYRQDGKRLHCSSAVCPHLKCLVHYNSLEKSFDCPCHGSRFSLTGEVLDGPALRALEAKTNPEGDSNDAL